MVPERMILIRVMAREETQKGTEKIMVEEVVESQKSGESDEENEREGRGVD